MSDIRVEALQHLYSRGTPFEKIAIDDISLEIPTGQYVALLGHTGSGKSTLIQHLNGLLSPTGGRILLGGEDIHRSKGALIQTRFRVGLVFQYPEYQLFEETVWKDIAFGPGNMGLSEEEIQRRVRRSARFAGVPEELFDQSPLELSGGQKRRVAIAGVMAMEPEVLILDEPMAGLDPAGCREILAHIEEYHRETGSTILLVTHDMDVAARVAERLVVLHEGHVCLDGTPAEIFSQADTLRQIGLDVPGSTLLAQQLRQLGLKIPASVYTPQQLCDAILSLGKEGGTC